MFAFGTTRKPRRLGLTPMIDVVFLLLVFFMLSARFGVDMSIPLRIGGAGASYSGPPRLIEISADHVTLNGVPSGDIVADLTPLMGKPEDIIVLRPIGPADVQRLLTVMEALRAAGFDNLVMAEGRE